MRRVIWTELARDDLREIERYTADFRLLAARRLASRIVEAAESLIDMPDRGARTTGGARLLATISPYLIRYRLGGEAIYILRVRHAARRRR